jgi:hypothetical protein
LPTRLSPALTSSSSASIGCTAAADVQRGWWRLLATLGLPVSLAHRRPGRLSGCGSANCGVTAGPSPLLCADTAPKFSSRNKMPESIRTRWRHSRPSPPTRAPRSRATTRCSRTPAARSRCRSTGRSSSSTPTSQRSLADSAQSLAPRSPADSGSCTRPACPIRTRAVAADHAHPRLRDLPFGILLVMLGLSRPAGRSECGAGVWPAPPSAGELTRCRFSSDACRRP